VRKILIFLTLAFISFGAIIFWQRDRIGPLLRPVQTLVPFSRQPETYDLVAVLEKNGLLVTLPPVTLGTTIQASISGVTVMFAADKDLATQVRALQLVLPTIKMEGKKAYEIDLRFNKVIIRYN
jgi:hypothetical protein